MTIYDGDDERLDLSGVEAVRMLFSGAAMDTQIVELELPFEHRSSGKRVRIHFSSFVAFVRAIYSDNATVS